MSAALQQKPEFKIKLTAVSGPHAGQVFQMSKEVVTIGRGSDNNVVLMNDPQVSRVHAQILVVDNELEVQNLSQKNAITIDGSAVQRWKIVNNSKFKVGDTEFNVEYDLGQAVVSVPHKNAAPKPSPTSSMAEVVPLPKAKPGAVTATPPPQAKPEKKKIKQKIGTAKSATANAPAVRQQQVARQNQVPATQGANAMQMAMYQQQMQMQQMQQMQMQQQAQLAYDAAQFQAQTNQSKNDSLVSNPNFKFILIAIIALIFGYQMMSKPDKKTQAKKIASTLKYEDEVNIQLASKKQKELEEARQQKLAQKNSLQSIRVNENFIKGMRDFQLGNYARAQEFFQLVLNLEPDHALAKRHNYLAKVRFDELVQDKLMLGESYYKKHNFRMCQAMYTQVVNMLQGKNEQTDLLLAEKKAKECELASQGIR